MFWKCRRYDAAAVGHGRMGEKKAKALKDLHEGGHDLAVKRDQRAATNLVLRATKVTAQSLGLAMSTLVVQKHHL